jgi:AmmeMemoRadiSam system protein B
MLGLSHRVRIEGVSILDSQACETPFGEVACDREFAERLSQKCGALETLWEAHLSEHSIETQLPFAQFYFPEARVVEVLTQDYSGSIPEQLGAAIAETAAELDRDILVVSSTDLSHYPGAETAKTVDRASLETLCDLDTASVRKKLKGLEEQGLPGVTCAVCSKASVLAGIEASRLLGARSGQIVDYLNSGDSPMGDRRRVVGYGAIAWRD